MQMSVFSPRWDRCVCAFEEVLAVEVCMCDVSAGFVSELYSSSLGVNGMLLGSRILLRL